MDAAICSPSSSPTIVGEKILTMTPVPAPSLLRDRAVRGRDSFGSVLCCSGSNVIPRGIRLEDFQDDMVMLVNCGGSTLQVNGSHLKFENDVFYYGGDAIVTNESIAEDDDYSMLYRSARCGNFSYKFEGLPPGDYFIDFHFAEIVFTNGPPGIRMFNVFVQDDKVLCEFDIYAVAGALQPLQIRDIRVSVMKDGVLTMKFEGIREYPVLCGVGIRKGSTEAMLNNEHLICPQCFRELVISPTQVRAQNKRLTTKFERKIEELTTQYKSKDDECHEAWMLLSSSNQQLQELRMEFDNKIFQADTFEQEAMRVTDELKVVSEKYERDKLRWAGAVNDLQEKILAIKQEQSQLSRDAHDCASSIPDLNKMTVAVQSLVAQCEDLKTKYGEEMIMRKKIYNQLQEMKGNIRVFCRCRPMSKDEESSGYATVIDFETAKDGEIGVINPGSAKKMFRFDHVFTPRDTQVDVYTCASPLVISVLDGYNVCIFAYGQTGTGKTFTMEGTEQNRGVNYRTLEELFKIACERKETVSYSISVSVLEVYNEQIRDLLAASPSTKKLEVKQAPDGFHHVPGIVEARVANIKEVWDVLQAGSSARAVGSNNVNEHSSRSHCMLCIMVRSKNLMNGDCTNSKLWLVDLAGSERLAKTEVQGDRLKEAQNINRSLSALGDVISSLANKSSHIPYRNSKLTHLLQDSLGGDSKALMFLQISPSENDVCETLSSLNFATRVRGVELGPAKKQIDTNEVQKMKQMLDKARHESRTKEESLRKLDENYQNLESKIRTRDQQCKNLQDKNKELECQLDSKLELQNLTGKELRGKEDMCMNLQQKVKESEYQLKELHSESLANQQKVKELELILKEQRQSESVLERKAVELEFMVQELENKLHEKENYEESRIAATPTDMSLLSRGLFSVKDPSTNFSTDEVNSSILRCSNSIRQANVKQASTLLKGHETKRRRELKSGATPVPDKEKIRKIDPSKAPGKLTRTRVAADPQKNIPQSRNNKNKHAVAQERSKITTGWIR